MGLADGAAWEKDYGTASRSMTLYEKIKEMSITDMAIFITRLQEAAIDEYEEKFRPRSIVENITLLNTEVTAGEDIPRIRRKEENL